MKNFALFSVLSLMIALTTGGRVQGQYEDKLGLPGDNLNLYAVMQLFQESETLEGFERNLNDENSTINNLDLDGDNRVDYIRVLDYKDGDDHTIVLQVALNKYENQDVAVFTVDRDFNGNVAVQLVGDEDLYGRNYIIEPYYADNAETANPGYVGNGNQQAVSVTRVTYVEVASWPLVRFIYMPNYVVWHSPWNYGYYPHYWRPWHPHYWDYYYGYHYNMYPHYYGYYHRWDHHRYDRYNDFYYHNNRAHAPMVHERIKSNYYQSTYSRPDLRAEGSARYQQRSTEMNTPSNGRRGGSSNVSNQAGANRNSSSGVSNSSNSRTSAGRSSTSVKQGANSGSNGRRTTVSSGSNRESNGSAASGRSSASQGSTKNTNSSGNVRKGNQGRTDYSNGTNNSNRSSAASRSNSSGSSTVSKSDNSGRSSASQGSRSSTSAGTGNASRKSDASQSSGRSSGRSSGTARQSKSSGNSSSAKESKSSSESKSSRRSGNR